MKRIAVFGAGALLLGGCALPLPVQVASWALDGLSYVTTQKSVADHGISIVANQDCAVLRGILDDGHICRDFDDGTTGIAVAGRAGTATAGDGAEALADFATAAGGDVTAGGIGINRRPIIAPSVRMNLKRVHKPIMFEDGVQLTGYPLVITVEPADAPATEVAARDATDAGTKAGTKPGADDAGGLADFATAAGTPATAAAPDAAPTEATPDDDAGAKPWRAKTSRVVDDGDHEPAAGLYFVIGSFRDHGNARKLRSHYRMLTPAVLAAKLDAGMVYRVVVGPFDQRQAKTVHQRIYHAGIIDAWAIRVKPGEWTMAMVDPPAATPLLADLNPEGSRWNPITYIRKLASWIY